MLSFRNSFLFSCFFSAISLFFPLPATPQAQIFSGFLPGSSAFPGSLQGCRDEKFFASKLGHDELTPYSGRERSNANHACKEFLLDVPSPRFSWKDAPPSSLPEVSPTGELENSSRIATAPPSEELQDIGERGTTVARVRQAVLEILESENACSAWFRRADPQVQATFRSLKFLVDEDGPHYMIRDRDGRGNWTEHGPYVARTKQNTGPGTTITLNAHGAFFRTKGEIYKVSWIGAEARVTGTWRHLEVGPYDGGTLQAQVIAVLHELAHVIGAIPWDDSSQVGYYRSQQNTELVLHYCKAEVSRSPKRLKLAMVQSPSN